MPLSSKSPSRKLRPYQEEGARWLADPGFPYKGRILADPMGFGKSVQALAAARRLIETGTVGESCVVALTPARAMRDWVREAKLFWPELPVHCVGFDDPVYQRKGETDESFDQRCNAVAALALKSPDPSLLLVSHESSWRVLDLAAEHEALIGIVIIDEAHRYKKTSIKKAFNAKSLVGRAARLICLTGTPIHNRAIDLYGLLELCAFSRYHSKWTFAKRFYAIETSLHGSKIGKLEDKAGLAAEVKDFLLARSVEEAYGELPPRLLKLVPVAPKRKFKAARVAATTELSQATALDSHLRAAVKTKLPALYDLVNELRDEPLLVYTYRRADAMEVCNKLNRPGDSAMLATGDTPARARDKIIEEWKQGAARVLVCTMDAVTESATLTRASAMIFLDFDWLASKMAQVMGRIDPARQPENERRPARYYFLFNEFGPDAVVARSLVEKMEEAWGIVGGEGGTALNSLRDLLAPQALNESPKDTLADLIARINTTAAKLEEEGLSALATSYLS